MSLRSRDTEMRLRSPRAYGCHRQFARHRERMGTCQGMGLPDGRILIRVRARFLVDSGAGIAQKGLDHARAGPESPAAGDRPGRRLPRGPTFATLTT